MRPETQRMVRSGGVLVHPNEEIAIMTTKKNNRTQQQTSDQELIAGLTKHQPTLSSLVIGGTSFKTADLNGILQTRIDAATKAVTARATWQAAVKADIEERTKTKTFVSGLRQALQVAFAGSIEALADFGLKPRKARVTTPEQKAAAAAKAKATRIARHTMGPKQKAQVKGTVPQAAPVTPPSPTTAPAAPKPADPPATGPAPAATPHP
jgi:hypothetical protein